LKPSVAGGSDSVIVGAPDEALGLLLIVLGDERVFCRPEAR